jgi:hypothetical protein
MLLFNHFFAPDLPVARRYLYIEACHKIAQFEWLIRWAENVESNAENLYSCYPFACHNDPEPVAITLRNARKTLVELMSEPESGPILSVLNYEITKLVSWRGRPAPTCWDTTSLLTLTDLTDYEP